MDKKKQTARHSEPGDTSQASDNVQETMAHSLKTEAEEGPSILQQRAEDREHSFRFSFESNPDPVFVSCNTFMTVFNALKISNIFSMNKSVNDTKKEIVILRADGAAVKEDFPCCLIEKDEILKITFIKKGKKALQEKQERLLPPRTGLVTFYIKTRGKKNMKYIMKNNELTDKADYVCVYAIKKEEVETALKRDGRFIDTIYQKLCLLSLESRGGAKEIQKSSYEMSNNVEHLDGKKFQIIATGGSRPDSQMKQAKVKIESDVASAADSAQNDPSQHPIGTEQKTIQERETNSAGPSAIGSATQNTYGNFSGDSGNSFPIDIPNIMHTLCGVVLEKLKQQNNPLVQKFYQEEYDKSIQSFTEVNNMKKIMKLSDSVCVIKVENTAQGTGFLLFDRFILTNAHVVQNSVYSPSEKLHTLKFSRTLTAVFNYEVLGSEAKVLPVKCDLVAYCYAEDDKLRQHDFALLELDTVKPENCTELLSCYRHDPSPNSGGIYIVGHPDCGVKKMDPCFIIGIEKRLQSMNQHISENLSCPYVSWECLPKLQQNHITYDSCFFHGSSGSPVFDEHCYLIGIHSGGFHYQGYRGRSVIEYSYSMQPILEVIIAQVKTRSDILKLLSEFESINKNFDLRPLEEQQSNKAEDMEVD